MNPTTVSAVDQAAAYVRDHLDMYGVDLSDEKQADAVRATVLWFSMQYLNAAQHRDVLGEVWALSCTAFTEALA